MTTESRPKDQNVADHEAGHLAVLDYLIALHREQNIECYYVSLSASISEAARTRGGVVFKINVLFRNREVGDYLVRHCLAGVAADALGELLDNLGLREAGISADGLKPYEAELQLRMEHLWDACGETDKESLDKDVVPDYIPDFVLQPSVHFMRALETVRHLWSNVLRISKALLRHKTITHETYDAFVIRGE